jgi:hypothetical protein
MPIEISSYKELLRDWHTTNQCVQLLPELHLNTLIETYLRGISVRVYLIGYILCIINCHIYRDIFGRIDIVYCRLPYVSRGVLPLKTLVLYIYQPRGTM